ncbi:dienelactone hydrolase family protein [Desulfobaculum sp. SPO524]|uniref:dienelactone hydrolase family protein n=1 Tax=Desulfobaculum sp. SPO524 TaxID=3378071 RepID=UPI0038537DD9
MQILLATEIWGRTPHVDMMADTFRRVAASVTVVDPYGGADQGFVSEGEAYARYVETGGLEAYTNRVRDMLATLHGPVALVGFSAGAGAVWAVSRETPPVPLLAVLCFYGSAIRTMMDTPPQVPTDAIFPAHEPHYCVDDVICVLNRAPHVHCHTTPHGHGFMNPLSVNYAPSAAAKWLVWAQTRLTTVAKNAEAL